VLTHVLFLQVLPGYQIKVVSAAHLNAIVYCSAPQEKCIVLFHHGSHFDVLTSLKGFFERSYWCHACDKGYDHKERHHCGATCSKCLREKCPPDQNTQIHCSDCNRKFESQACFDHHKLEGGVGGQKKREKICGKLFVCRDCNRLVSTYNRNADNLHQCGEYMCQYCHVYALPDEHQCYMQPLRITEKKKKENLEARFIFFDFETYVAKNNKLVPNLVVCIGFVFFTRQLSNQCLVLQVAQYDNGDEEVFPRHEQQLGQDVSEAFCSWLFTSEHKGFYVIAHNFRVSTVQW
jgi:hypothetical protein